MLAEMVRIMHLDGINPVLPKLTERIKEMNPLQNQG